MIKNDHSWRTVTFHDAIQEAYDEEFSRDRNRIIVGENIEFGFPQTKITLPLLKEKYPERVLNHVPLVEEMLPGIALGMSIGGLRPTVQFNWPTFVALALDQLYRLGIWRYRMAETKGPGVIIRIGHNVHDTSGSELSASMLGVLFHLPNIKIVTPSYPYFAKGLLKTAFKTTDPVVFVEHRMLYENRGPILEGEYKVPFGSSFVSKQGKDVTIITWMLGTFRAWDAAQKLAEEKIEVEILSLQTLVPMDMNTILASVKKTGRVVILEDDMLRGGIGAEIASRICESVPGTFVRRLGLQNVPLPPHPRFIPEVIPTVEKISRACR